MSALLDLDRKLSRAAERGKGIRLTADQLDTIVSLGIIERLSEEKARILKENARWRRLKATKEESTKTKLENIGSTMIGDAMELPQVKTSTSGGTTHQPDTSAVSQLARAIFD